MTAPIGASKEESCDDSEEKKANRIEDEPHAESRSLVGLF